MNAKNLIRKRKKSPYKMDKDSDRYRVCPNDGVSFMASHRSEIFCPGGECADEFHNTKKRDTRKTFNRGGRVEALVKDMVEKEKLEKVKANVELIDGLEFNREKGAHFNMDSLEAMGLDFFSDSGGGKLYNIDSSLNCHFRQMGPYRLYRVKFSTVFIIKIT